MRAQHQAVTASAAIVCTGEGPTPTAFKLIRRRERRFESCRGHNPERGRARHRRAWPAGARIPACGDDPHPRRAAGVVRRDRARSKQAIADLGLLDGWPGYPVRDEYIAWHQFDAGLKRVQQCCAHV
jgi:hypothetical protein